jgi:hypothetical protein
MIASCFSSYYICSLFSIILLLSKFQFEFPFVENDNYYHQENFVFTSQIGREISPSNPAPPPLFFF